MPSATACMSLATIVSTPRDFCADREMVILKARCVVASASSFMEVTYRLLSETTPSTGFPRFGGGKRGHVGGLDRGELDGLLDQGWIGGVAAEVRGLHGAARVQDELAQGGRAEVGGGELP